MFYQYINPYIQKPVLNQPQLAPLNMPQTQSNIINPYQTSFYNPNNTYPYNPNFTPKIAQAFTKTNEIQAPNGETAHFYKLENGHTVVVIPRKDEATIVKTFVDAGSMNETDEKRGVSHLNEHGLFKGSAKYKDGDVFRLTGLMGANTNASTDFAEIKYYITAPYMGLEELDKTLSIQGDMVYNPKFDKEAMESEKGPVCSEISMINDDATTIAFDKTIRNLFQIQSTSKNLVAGSIETVQNLSTDDMKNYHQTYYRPDNMYTVVVADSDIEPDKVAQMAAKYFKAVSPKDHIIREKKETLTPITKPIREDIISPRASSTSVIMAFSGPKPQDSKDFIIATMLDFYLGQCSTSDLKNNLEKMNAVYDSTTQKVGLRKDDPYALVSVIDSNPYDEQKGLDAFYDAIQKLQSTPLSDEEMTILKNCVNKNYALSTCDSESVCETMGTCLMDNSLDLFTNYKDIANSITKEDIMNFARKYYDLNKISITVVHPNYVSEKDIQNNYSKSKYSFANLQKARNNNSISFCGAKKVDINNNVKEYNLQNNTHLAINKTNSDLCVFNWSVNTPPIQPKNPNIPAVLRYMFQKGTDYKNTSELEKYMQLNAIDADVYINGKTIEINADCLPENASKTLELMNELMYHPNLTRNDFEEAKKYIKEDLSLSKKDANSTLLDRLYPEFFPTDNKKLNAIDSLKFEDVVEFYEQLLKSASSNFVATIPDKQYAALESEVIKNQSVSNITFQNSTPKLYPIFEANKEATVVYDTDDLNQAQIYKTYKFPMSGNIEDEIKFEMVNLVLGGTPNSRLFSDLREKQNLAYSVSSSIQSFENTGILTLRIQTTTDDEAQNVQSFDNVQKSLDGFKNHTDKLKNELITDEELTAAKMQLKQNIIGQCQNPISETGLLASNMTQPYGIQRVEKYIEAIDKMTKEDVQKAANFIFSQQPTISILASEKTINSQIEYLKTQGKLVSA